MSDGASPVVNGGTSRVARRGGNAGVGGRSVSERLSSCGRGVVGLSGLSCSSVEPGKDC
ncbi:MAG: hypothetical protein QF363_00775 [Planctomycetaceae bacterium]|nr:hypothetical protein [Planctomycetaceae bacterium]